MKKLILALAAAVIGVAAFAFPKAIYVKKGDTYTKYNFGVAGDLKFSNGGKTLTITGYSEAIDLDNIDYVTFDAPVDDQALTPSAQKSKMIEIGEAVYNMVNVEDNAELMRMYHTFFDHIDDKCPPCEYEVPREYWDVHRSAARMLKAAMQMAKGNPAAARVFKSNAVNTYKASDYFGIYSPDYDKERWKKIASADYLEIRFLAADKDNYKVRLVASDEYTTWNTGDFNGQMPKIMTITFLKGNDTLASAVINTTLVQDKSIDMTVHFDANGYVADNTLKVSNNAIDDEVIVTIKGKYLCKATSHIDGANLVNYDEMYNAFHEATHYHNENDECCGDDPHELFAHFIRANANVDIIGQLQAKGKVFGLNKLYDALAEDSDIYWTHGIGDGWQIYTRGRVINRKGDVYDVCENERSVVENHAKYLNNYTDISFYYDGQKQLQGYFTWDADEQLDWENDSYWDEYSRSHNAYTIVDGLLVNVDRKVDYVWMNDHTEEVLGDWYYYKYKETDDEYLSGEVIVNPSNLIWPETIRYYYCESAPVLVFPDLTSFAFEDYFTEDSFSKLIDDYNDIIDTYFSVTGQERDNDDDDYDY